MEICNNIGLLKAIYFIKLCMNIIFIIVPIGLIIMGTIDLSKSLTTGDEKEQKKNLNLFLKRLISACILFAIPWIISTFMRLLGDLSKDINYTDCFNNANKDYIDSLEED